MGEAMAKQFADAGSRVVIVDIDAERARSVEADLRENGHEAMAAAIDITDSAKVESLVKDVAARYGRLDVLCNNAGIMDGFLPVTELPEKIWHRVIDVNLTAPYLLSKYALEVMLPRGQGAIVNTASTAAVTGGLAGAGCAP